ncbi:Nucleotide-binding alpha-beta plait domain containing protein [Trema orientale]|uniref:Nucleotide-binding alpha-beta plait domain containing protein n=1 Tax=Trema orientale TaxID=63057 RepID=A0A2P5FXQ0_TREOI|nr:Nucleotide-binding alpha-beta plait domain containing protein [Trema orientale]
MLLIQLRNLLILKILVPGVGKVFLEYAEVEGASKAREGLNRRKFAGKQVVAVFYPEDKFAEGDYDA